jgi:L-fuconolactonase
LNAAMTLDSHQHFWKYDPREYSWIAEPMAVLKRDFLPEDLAREQARVQFDGSIAVQARQTLEETRWLLELARTNQRIRAVVGWVDLRSPSVANDLEHFCADPKFVGVRHVVQDEPDPRFMLQPDFLRGLGLLKNFGLTYDILIFPNQLPAAIEVARRLPDQPFVLDHIAKPPIAQGTLEPWAKQIRTLGECPNVSCKVSGLVTEAEWKNWNINQFTPYLDVVTETFGEDRLMVGSDWPVCLLSASYEQVVGLVRDHFKSFSPEARKKIFGGNASRFYTRRKRA